MSDLTDKSIRKSFGTSALIGRLLPAIILLLLAWAAMLALTSGVDVRLVGIRISSRDPFRPTLIASVLLILYVTVFRHHAAAHVMAVHRGLERVSPIAGVGLAVLTFVIGMRFGMSVAGGSDSYGYVSQADLWLSRHLVLEQPLATKVPWPGAIWTFTPLGYRPAADRPDAIVPAYAPGLPMLMAVAKVVLSPIASGQCGPYIVAPAFGALLTWLTWWIGWRLVSPLAGVGAAVVIASSPGIISALITPMSDVPVAALFVLALVIAMSNVRGHVFWTGLVTAVAILVRPNLVPVAGVFAAWFWFRAKGWRARTIAVATFGVGVLPAVIAIALIHTHLYGAPWKSGYGGLEELYAFRFLPINIERYARWLVTMHTPLMVLCVVPFLAWRWVSQEQRAPFLLLGGVTAVIWISYLFYLPFEVWEYLRFVLTAFPLMTVLALAGLRILFRRLPPALGSVGIGTLVLLVVAFQADRVHEQGLTARWQGEASFISIARFVDRTLPKNAVILSMFHSGSLRHYTGRLTMRYDLLDRQWWPRALEVLTQHGYRPYVVLADWEERQFHEQLGIPADVPAGAIVGQLHSPLVRVYDPLTPADAASQAGGVKPATIPDLVPCPCTSRDGARPR